jgi:hypothetical protein
VGPRGVPTEGHQVTLNHLILDGEVEIGEGPHEPGNELLPLTDATEWLGYAGDVDDAVGPNAASAADASPRLRPSTQIRSYSITESIGIFFASARWVQLRRDG